MSLFPVMFVPINHRDDNALDESLSLTLKSSFSDLIVSLSKHRHISLSVPKGEKQQEDRGEQIWWS